MSKTAEKLSDRGMRDFRHSLPMELLKAREAAMSRFRPMLRNHGLTEQQWRVIRALAEVDQMDASELASRCLLLAPSLTRILQHLEKEGIIRRDSDASDQRRSFLLLTERGSNIFREVAPESERLYAEIEQQFGASRLEELYRLLAEFYQSIDALPDD
ncbi:MAG: homoprotocatechuate degradation operon regulator HpaR [Gammaproteobacteria bacterium]|nr:homoprotocatechuate degradation operon regulator HpaR [Gammaproteobacteria bacterium]